MSNLKNMLRWEFILQLRYKIIHISIASVFMYFLATEAVPMLDASEFHVIMLFFDPAIIGIMFVGALILFEKSENTLQSLVVTPMKTNDYILSKTISLTTLSIISATLFTILMVITSDVEFNLLYLYLGIILTSIMLILLGIVLVSRVNSINEYLLGMVIIFLSLTLPPMLYITGIYENILFYLWPTQAAFVLLEGVVSTIETWEIAYAIIYLIIWIGILFILSKKAFYKHIIMKGG